LTTRANALPMDTRVRILAAAALVPAALGLGGCGGDQPSETTAVAETTVASETTESPTPPSRSLVRQRPPQVRVVLPEGWSADTQFGRLDGPSGLSIWFGDPKSTAWDSRAGIEVEVPRDLTDLIARSPYVRVLDHRTVKLGGTTARQIDVVATRGDPKRGCPISDRYEEPCVPVTTFTPEPYEVQDVSISLSPGEPKRIIDVQYASGRLVIVVRGFDRFSELAAVENILRTMQVG